MVGDDNTAQSTNPHGTDPQDTASHGTASPDTASPDTDTHGTTPHDTDTHDTTSHGTKAVLAALVANFVIAVAKLVGFTVTSSASLLAESFHSFADSGNQALLLFGHRQARKPPTPKHPFGYGRERYFWSFVVAMVLFILGSVFAIMEGIDKLRHPHELKSLTWAIAILGGAIILESFSFRIAVKEANAVRGKASWKSFVRNSKSPELPVILLEDLGAMVGLCFAFIAVIVAEITGNPRWDGVGTLAIGILLGLIAWVLAIEMKSLLIGESATTQMRTRLLKILETSSHVKKVVSLRTQHLGPDQLLVTARVQFDVSLSGSEITKTIDEIHLNIQQQVPIVAAIYLEPDFHHD